MTNLLLGIATLITVVLSGLTLTGSLPTGSDWTGTIALFVFLTCPRWCSVAVVLGILLGQGDFNWISACRRMQTMVVMTTYSLMGLAVLVANVLLHTGGVPEEFRGAVLLFTLGVPVLVLLYAGALANPSWIRVLPEDGMRKTACSAVGLCGLAMVAMLVLSAQRTVAAAAAVAPAGAYEQAMAQLNAVPANAPVSAYLRFLHGQPGDISSKARHRIVSRPNYQNELAELLANPEWSREVLSYIRTEMMSPSPSMAPAAANAVRLLAEGMESQLAQDGVAVEEQFGFDCRLAIEIADRFPQQDHLFVEPMRMLRATATAHPRAVSAGVRQELTDWLARHAPVLEARARRRY